MESGDVDVSFGLYMIKFFSQNAFEHAPGGRPQQHESEQVGQEARRDQNDSGHQYDHGIHQLLCRHDALVKAGFYLEHGIHPLHAGNPGTRKTGGQYEKDGIEPANHRSHLDEQIELNHRDQGKT